MELNKRNIFLFMGLSLLFCCIFHLSQTTTVTDVLKQQKEAVALRVAIDLNKLPVADPFLHYAGNEVELNEYINALNLSLQNKGARLTVLDINTSGAGESKNSEILTLTAPHRNFYVAISIDNSKPVFTFIFPFIMALIGVAFYSWNRKKHIAAKVNKVELPENLPEFKLIIDLHSKTVTTNRDKQVRVQLANKPLCFYLALIEYCDVHPDVILNQNKAMPEPLLELADKYFYRLVELGHTIRKRPNFTNSLEKTLSEIRAALDEALEAFPEKKALFYPPKAHGEGSRSKLHSYGLNGVKKSEVEVIGK
ncbi:hypothetical protein [Pseudoalteromonas peptidolytica]|uniref:Uncharacterized protein n=1 Tax=Pseudoalteromonas peptidolytica F12-50-A1 TaxID=1315280 RepID=A0A8I0MZ05_9GAMM|nr:hypothetical protein [Pseudoalteromonas peptidolytica]MBE0348639.1 hypothetical protein [Pseudoalteromonas peptidolytica F12-50-A1]NLR15742.1 hypothetical protein [Pseudoalteromonas peptidolytica]GEK10531.1 hypothetical protein PPE03_27800 [Pseudoalteromonas peptidolytica]